MLLVINNSVAKSLETIERLHNTVIKVRGNNNSRPQLYTRLKGG